MTTVEILLAVIVGQLFFVLLALANIRHAILSGLSLLARLSR